MISRTVTVMQYRIAAQYVWMAEANGMKTNHVAGIPLPGEGVVGVRTVMAIRYDGAYQEKQRRAIRP